MHRFRLISLVTNRILWTPLRDGFAGKFEVYNPQVALMMAEGILEMQGDEFVAAKPAVVAGDGEPDIAGILIRGRRYGVIIEGAEFLVLGIRKNKNVEDSLDSSVLINNFIPDLIKEISRLNDNFERALDYYAVETYGRVPKAEPNEE